MLRGVTGVDYRAMKVLVALSNKQLGETIWHYLKDSGVGQVQLVDTMKEAVHRMQAFQFTHFFLDFDFGDHGGSDFAKFIRMCDGAVSEAPIIMIMPTPSKDKVFTARDAGVNEILGLPLTGKQIDTRLQYISAQPKPFVRAATYIGPCRRREVMQVFHGKDRRREAKGPNAAGPQPYSRQMANAY
ncbi:hypothetical protein [Kordiimonas lacus]|uniref:Response regulator receiver domain-containing protein n=1 Tax=Kordiimonas lacus TaxID=637679 RepID=A0A1G6ZT25_9PROT|nr:hypothetical protein [Kordiimonas lacus]SDE05671.1 Response regulator receiver domain-containing protein [Kordiimonas lacus]